MKQKKIKYKLNFKKIKRNIIILILLTIAIMYSNYINNYTDKNIKSCQAFVEYAHKNNISLTQDEYINFMNK